MSRSSDGRGGAPRTRPWIEAKLSGNRKVLPLPRSTPGLQGGKRSRSVAPKPGGSSSSSSSSGLHRHGGDSSSTALRSECAVVWSNAAYRSIGGGSSSSGSSSENRTGRKGCWKSMSSAGDRHRHSQTSSIGATSSFGSLGSTRKALCDDPAFRKACFPAIVEDDGWIHGPDRNIEGEVMESIVQAEIEDENDRKIEEELQSGIAALSKKLADLQCVRGEKRVDRLTKTKQAGMKNSKNSRDREKAPIVAKPRPIRSNPERNRAEDPKEKKIVAAVRRNNAPTKPIRKDSTKTQRREVEEQQAKPVRLEDLKLSPRFWGKNFDWAKSLRSSKPPEKKPPTIKPAKKEIAVLGEKINRQEKIAAPGKRFLKAPRTKALSKPAKFASKPARVLRRDDDENENLNFPVFTLNPGD